jgi:hypothetical protein
MWGWCWRGRFVLRVNMSFDCGEGKTGSELFDVFFGVSNLCLERLDCSIHLRQFTILGSILIILQ